MSQNPPSVPGHPHYRGFTITPDTPHSIGLLWTRDRFAVENSTWQYRIFTRKRHPWPQRDSNPQSQEASGLRPTALGRAAIEIGRLQISANRIYGA